MSPRKSPAKPKTAPKKEAPPPKLQISEAPVVPPRSVKPYVALLIVGLLLLGGSAVLALPGTMSGPEQQVFSFINGAHLPAWVSEQIAKPISNAVWGMIGLLAVLLLVPKFRLRAWRYSVAGGAAYVTNFLIEHLVGRARPDGLPYEVVLRASQSGPGFPSGHVAVLTALGLTIWPFVSWPWRILIVLLIGAEAWSRVFLGVHAPLDVVGGVAVGMIVVATIRLLPTSIRTFFKLGR